MIGCKALIHTYQALQLFLSPYFSAIDAKFAKKIRRIKF